jgi:hypothetical protein
VKQLAVAIICCCAWAGCGDAGTAGTGSGFPAAAATPTATAAATVAPGSAYTCPTATTSTGTLNCTALPLGDAHYSTSAPKVGSVFVCQVPNGQGANGTPPWINTTAGTWNALSKVVVSGSLTWPGAYSATSVNGGTGLSIVSNGLPIAPFSTGTFPIAASDPAYQYDQNPNSIDQQTISFTLPANPAPAASPGCLSGGRIGIAIDGVSIYDALDALGRDAVAHEEQDSCHGHPDQSSTYHYHGWLQACIADGGSATTNSTLIGYALDGYGIYGPWYNGKVLTTADLDACHGITSVVNWHGSLISVYHYVSTYDFPYTVGCYHGTPVSG